MNQTLLDPRTEEHNETHEIGLIECARKMVSDGGESMGRAATELRQKYEFANQFTPKNGTTITASDCVKAMIIGFYGESSYQWQVAAAANRLVDLGYDNVLNQVCEMFGRSYSTISAWMRTERRVMVNDRFKLEFTAYNEIVNARYDKDPQTNKSVMEGVLREAIEYQVNSTTARHMVQDKKGKKLPEIDPSVKDRYLRVELETGDTVTYSICNEVPESSSTWVTFIDLKKKCYLTETGEWKEIERK